MNSSCLSIATPGPEVTPIARWDCRYQFVYREINVTVLAPLASSLLLHNIGKLFMADIKYVRSVSPKCFRLT